MRTIARALVRTSALFWIMTWKGGRSCACTVTIEYDVADHEGPRKEHSTNACPGGPCTTDEQCVEECVAIWEGFLQLNPLRHAIDRITVTGKGL